MFRVLGLEDPEWMERIEALPPDLRDIHFTPFLLAPYVAAFGWKAGLAVTSEQDQFIIQPLLVNDKGELRHAYNFGGPVGTDDAQPLKYKHFNYVKLWAEQNGAERSYATLNPFLAAYQDLLVPVGVTRVKDVVYMDLKSPSVRGTTRRLANKAQGAGVVVNDVPRTVGNAQLFYNFYTLTMTRAQAAKHWFLPAGFFHSLLALVPTSALLVATLEGKPQAACIVIGSPNGIAYYHFAGSLNQHPKLGISHAMVLAAAEFAANVLDCDKLHLGGGVKPHLDDGLLTFKAGFSDLRAPVFTYG